MSFLKVLILEVLIRGVWSPVFDKEVLIAKVDDPLKGLDKTQATVKMVNYGKKKFGKT